MVQETAPKWSRVVRNLRTDADTDERYTPEWVLKLVDNIMGEIDLDPCADLQKRVIAKRHFTKNDNGLDQGWSGKVFLNPPFSASSEWIKHFCIYYHSGAISEGIIILPVMTLSNKSASLLMKATATAFTLLGRKLSFLDQDYKDIGEMSAFPFALVYCGQNTEKFLEITEKFGIACLIRNNPENIKPTLCAYCGKPFNAKRISAKFCGSTCRSKSHKRKNYAK